MNNSINNNTATNNNSKNNGGMIMVNATIKTMDVFAQVVKEEVESRLGNGYVASIHDVLKNNNTHLTGISIKTEESNVAPTIYLDSMFDRYVEGEVSVSDVVSQIISVYKSHEVTVPFDVSKITEYSACKEKICYKLVNAMHNRDLLLDTPHRIVVGDLAVIYYILVSDDKDGSATITIRNNMSEAWGVTEEELYETALENTQRLYRGSVKNMAAVMQEILFDHMDDENAKEFFDMAVSEDDTMYVCTNFRKINGAGVLLYDNLLKEFADKTGSDFYILPSSIHETLLVPVSDEMSVEYLRSLVYEVNRTQVAPEEVLSDNVYLYSRKENKICIA